MTDFAEMTAEEQYDILCAEKGYDRGADGKWVEDEFKIWNHLTERFNGRRALDTELPQRMALAHHLQNTYNAAAETALPDCPKCRGILVKRKDKPVDWRRVQNWCRGAMCPVCWSNAQTKCLRRIRMEADNFQTIYLRETQVMHLDEAPHPAVWQAFQANGSRYRLLAWSIGFEQYTEYGVAGEDVRGDGVGVWPVGVKYVGLWAPKPVNGEDRPIQERGVTVSNRGELRQSHGTVIDRSSGATVGSIRRTNVHGYDHAIDLWLEAVGHPSDFRFHSSYGPAIQALDRLVAKTFVTGRVP